MYGLDLFSGIGGITLALKGYVRPVAYCENDRYCQAVLLSRMADGSIPIAPIWDDGKAAEAFRLEQARRLIRVSVEIMDRGGEKTPFRVFVSLSTDRIAGGYRSMVSVMGDAKNRERLLTDARDEMWRFQEKYAMLQELVEVFEAMRNADKTLATA